MLTRFTAPPVIVCAIFQSRWINDSFQLLRAKELWLIVASLILERTAFPRRRKACPAARMREGTRNIAEAVRVNGVNFYAENWINAPPIEKMRRLNAASKGSVLVPSAPRQ